MIGGAMLACAVGAMLLIARWSLQRDDAADPATGLLALRTWSERTAARKDEKRATRRRRRMPEGDPEAPRLKANGKRDRRPDPATRRRRGR